MEKYVWLVEQGSYVVRYPGLSIPPILNREEGIRSPTSNTEPVPTYPTPYSLNITALMCFTGQTLSAPSYSGLGRPRQWDL